MRTESYIIIFAGACLLYLMFPVLLPFLLSFVIAYFILPVVTGLSGLGLNRRVATVLAMIFVPLAIVTAFSLIVPFIYSQVHAHLLQVAEIATASDSLRSLSDYYVDMKSWNFKEYIKGIGGQALLVLRSLISSAVLSGAALVRFLSNIVIIPIAVYYFLVEWEEIRVNIRSVIPKRMKAQVISKMSEIDKIFKAFIRGQFIISILMGLYYSIALGVTGLNGGVALGIMIGMLSFFPYVGFIIGLILSCTFAILQFKALAHIILILLIFMLGQIIEGYVLPPYLLSDNIKLHPIAVIFGISAGAYLFGFIGVMIALPLTAMAVVFIRYCLKQYKKSEVYK